MKRANLGVALAWAAIVEVALWGLRSGPGWMLLLLAAGVLSAVLLRRWERSCGGWTAALWLSGAGFATAPLLYDAELVHSLAPPLCLLTLLLAVHFTLVGPTTPESLTDTQLFSLAAMGQACQAERELAVPASPSVWRGLGLAAPMLLVFGALFVAADPAFASGLQGLFGEWADLVALAVRLQVWTLLGAAVLFQAQRFARPGRGFEGAADDPVSLSLALGLTSALFVSFLVFQWQYLFAGRAPVGMSLAEYARHGFFELFVACLCVVALTAWAHGSVFRHPDPAPARRNAMLLVCLTFGLVASSTQRMWLYVQHFGLTPTRAYVLMTLLGIAFTLLLCLWCLSRWHPPAWLRARLLLLGMGTLATVGLVNVERLVARANLRTVNPAGVDYAYLATLSCDVLPELDFSKPAERAVAQQIVQRTTRSGWREWNLNRSRLEAYQAELVDVDKAQVGQLEARNHGQRQE